MSHEFGLTVISSKSSPIFFEICRKKADFIQNYRSLFLTP